MFRFFSNTSPPIDPTPTTTTTTTTPPRPCRLLQLPPELRIQIYSLALQNVQSHPFYIRRHLLNNTWQLWSRKSPLIPSLLLLNKQIHAEAKDVLSSFCRPVFILDDFQFATCRRELPVARRTGRSDGYVIQPISGIKDVLQRLEYVKFEVEVVCSALHQGWTIMVLRFVVAVLNAREEELVGVAVDFMVLNPRLRVKAGDGLVEVIRSIRTERGTNICILEGKGYAGAKRERLELPAVVGSVCDGGREARKLEEDIAWRALQKASWESRSSWDARERKSRRWRSLYCWVGE